MGAGYNFGIILIYKILLTKKYVNSSPSPKPMVKKLFMKNDDLWHPEAIGSYTECELKSLTSFLAPGLYPVNIWSI